MNETAAPVFPAIAQAAHVSGPVVMLATFDRDGGVTAVRTFSGPQMLRGAAETFVKSWRANPTPAHANARSWWNSGSLEATSDVAHPNHQRQLCLPVGSICSTSGWLPCFPCYYVQYSAAARQ